MLLARTSDNNPSGVLCSTAGFVLCVGRLGQSTLACCSAAFKVRDGSTVFNLITFLLNFFK